ncbi:hypothetical protein Tco_1222952 [Tanacetum coccineum]
MLDMAWISSSSASSNLFPDLAGGQLGDAMAVGLSCWTIHLVLDLSVNRSFTPYLVMPPIRVSMQKAVAPPREWIDPTTGEEAAATASQVEQVPVLKHRLEDPNPASAASSGDI